jgi:hypothetical protein
MPTPYILAIIWINSRILNGSNHQKVDVHLNDRGKFTIYFLIFSDYWTVLVEFCKFKDLDAFGDADDFGHHKDVIGILFEESLSRIFWLKQSHSRAGNLKSLIFSGSQ